MNTLKSDWTAAANGRSTGRRSPRPTAWRRTLTTIQLAAWPALLAALCAVGLLFAFQQVVQAGVEKGEARNRAVIAHADAVKRCDLSLDPGQRAVCHAQLGSVDLLGEVVPSTRYSTQREPVALARR